MKKVVRLTESDLYKIVRKVIIEQSEQSKKLYTSWAKNKSGNFDAAMSIMDDVLIHQKSLPKKDFANYSSYEELKNDLQNIVTKQKEKDAVKVYEDDSLLVIQANTWEAGCKYGSGTKWCTAAKDTSIHWQRHNNTGTEFIWIFKGIPQSNPQYKYSYFISSNGTDWCDSLNNCTKNLSDKSLPKKHPKYEEIINKLNEIHSSRIIISRKSEREQILEILEDWVNNNAIELFDSLDKKDQITKYFLNYEWEQAFDNSLDHNLNVFLNDFEDQEFSFDDIEELKGYLANNLIEIPDITVDDTIVYALAQDILHFIFSLENFPRTVESIENFIQQHSPESLISEIIAKTNPREDVFASTKETIREEFNFKIDDYLMTELIRYAEERNLN